MKKLLLTLIAVTALSSTAYAGVLNNKSVVYPTVKSFIDNAKDTSNYSVGSFHNLEDKASLQNISVNVYDFTGTEEVLQPEGENLKHYFDYASVLVGYADNQTVNAALVVNVLPTIKGALVKTPYARTITPIIPDWVDVYFGPAFGYDFGDDDIAYGVVTNVAVDYKF